MPFVLEDFDCFSSKLWFDYVPLLVEKKILEHQEEDNNRVLEK